GFGLVVAIEHVFRNRIETSREDERAVHHCLDRLVVRHAVDVQGHRKIKFNLVTGFPDPIERQIAAGTGERRKHRTVYLYAATLRPVGNSDVDSKLRWGLRGNRERGSLLLREASRLREPQTFFRPLKIRIDVKVHVE